MQVMFDQPPDDACHNAKRERPEGHSRHGGRRCGSPDCRLALAYTGSRSRPDQNRREVLCDLRLPPRTCGRTVVLDAGTVAHPAGRTPHQPSKTGRMSTSPPRGYTDGSSTLSCALSLPCPPAGQRIFWRKYWRAQTRASPLVVAACARRGVGGSRDAGVTRWAGAPGRARARCCMAAGSALLRGIGRGEGRAGQDGNAGQGRAGAGLVAASVRSGRGGAGPPPGRLARVGGRRVGARGRLVVGVWRSSPVQGSPERARCENGAGSVTGEGLAEVRECWAPFGSWPVWARMQRLGLKVR